MVAFVDGITKYRKYRSFCNYRNFRSFRNFREAFLATLWINFVDFDNDLDNDRKFRSFCKFRNFHSFHTFRWAFPATLWINFVDFVHGLDNYRKFRSFRKFRNFRSFRNFRWAFLATLWINFVDFGHGLDNYCKFRSFRNCVQSWALLCATVRAEVKAEAILIKVFLQSQQKKKRMIKLLRPLLTLQSKTPSLISRGAICFVQTNTTVILPGTLEERRTSHRTRATFGAKLKPWTQKIFHYIFHVLQYSLINKHRHQDSRAFRAYWILVLR